MNCPIPHDVVELRDEPEADVTKGPRDLLINATFRNPKCCLKRGHKSINQVIAIHSSSEHIHTGTFGVYSR